jgi:hypothetical protein
MVGDCYYLSSESAASEVSSRVKNMFITDYTPQGMIVVRAIVLGVPTYITLDDTLAFYKSMPSTLAFSRPESSTNPSIYTAFLEKAWIKANGNVDTVEGGWIGEVMQFFAGTPTVTYWVKYNDATASLADWNRVNSADQVNWVMIAGTYSDSLNCTNSYTKIGLVCSHAYTILSTHNVSDAAGKSYLLYKIRNPWGSDD